VPSDRCGGGPNCEWQQRFVITYGSPPTLCEILFREHNKYCSAMDH
jgi:hypothetical protein